MVFCVIAAIKNIFTVRRKWLGYWVFSPLWAFCSCKRIIKEVGNEGKIDGSKLSFFQFGSFLMLMTAQKNLLSISIPMCWESLETIIVFFWVLIYTVFLSGSETYPKKCWVILSIEVLVSEYQTALKLTNLLLKQSQKITIYFKCCLEASFASISTFSLNDFCLILKASHLNLIFIVVVKSMVSCISELLLRHHPVSLRRLCLHKKPFFPSWYKEGALQ